MNPKLTVTAAATDSLVVGITIIRSLFYYYSHLIGLSLLICQMVFKIG